MKKFYVYSGDQDIDVNKLWTGGGYATMIFWKDCAAYATKCPAAQYMIKKGATNTNTRNERHLFNFPTTVGIDEIRKCVYRAHDLCRNCKGNCR